MTTKFGVPRQSGLAKGLVSRIVFSPEYRKVEALRGLEGFSHIWILWLFNQVPDNEEWHPTVRPPRLGGNQRMGVFATRSPFRPNRIGLSCVRLEKIETESERGPILYVEGADLMNGTPILDIKPYLPFTDSHPEATGGFTNETLNQKPLEVRGMKLLDGKLNKHQQQVLQQLLEDDPRPHYHDDATRTYGMEYAGIDVWFKVYDGVVTIVDGR